MNRAGWLDDLKRHAACRGLGRLFGRRGVGEKGRMLIFCVCGAAQYIWWSGRMYGVVYILWDECPEVFVVYLKASGWSCHDLYIVMSEEMYSR